MRSIAAASRASLRFAVLALLFLVILPTAPLGASTDEPAKGAFDPELLAGMKARSLGPATMSGRIAALAADPSDPRTLYVGAATGGLWKTTNGGFTWNPVFDDQPVAAIGAIALDPTAPDVLWVGTGEGNPRNSASVGNGIYKSLDGGRTWQHLGLEKSERIHRIHLHPTDPKTAWVAALGTSWGENEERGVFRTRDGGTTWQKVLYVDPRTGAADLALDPANPQKLIAALWDHRRWPWSFRSGGPGSGLYLSYDGGETWKKLTEEDGLPAGDLGRIGVAFAPSDPKVVYALVEALQNVLLRSDDGGETWATVNSEPDIAPRPFYYADLRVDPTNPDHVYSLASLLSRSKDGGKSFQVIAPFATVHPDHQALWINPDDPRHLINGNDGGISESLDGGGTWRFVGNLPLAQFYHVRVDDDVPYNIYGGLQDNGSWRGPSEVWENGGIRNYHWQEVTFGDGFDTVPDPTDSMRGYAMFQGGNLLRWNLHTGEVKIIRPAPERSSEKDLRFNWNAAIALDPFTGDSQAPPTLYYGSQFVHKSEDRGETWQVISPDLTTDRPEWQKQDESGGLTLDVTNAENFTSLVALAPSPVEAGILWAGSDDGRLHVTRDGGATWTSVEANIPGVPAHTWIPHIAPSPHRAGTAFVVLDDHRRANWTPYVFRTDDFGATWTSLATEDLWGYALTLVQDPVDEDLLFLGTEFGLWASLDAGASWFRWTHGVPTVSVMDLAFQAREADLVLGTHGRGLYVLDDISPLRNLEAGTLQAPLHFFPPSPAQQHQVGQTGSSRFPGSVEFRGENEPYGAVFTVVVHGDDVPFPDEERERARKEESREAEAAEKAENAEEDTKEDTEEDTAEDAAEEPKPEPEIRFEIRPMGDDGVARDVLRTLKAPVVRGVNRVVWNLRRDGFKEPAGYRPPEAGEPEGPEVPAGTYQVTAHFRDQEAAAALVVEPDPRNPITEADRQAKWETLLRAGAIQETVTEAVERLQQTRADIDRVLAKVAPELGDDGTTKETKKAEDDPKAQLQKDGGALQTKLTELEARFLRPPDAKGIPAPTEVGSRLGRAVFYLGSTWNAPRPADLVYLGRAEDLLAKVLTDFNRLYAEDVAKFRAQIREMEIELLEETEPLEVPAP